MKFRSALACAAALALFQGCNPPPDDDDDSAAAAGGDAGSTAADASAVPDAAGYPTDAAALPDAASLPPDAATPPDAAVDLPDAAVPPDAAVDLPDAAATSDAAVDLPDAATPDATPAPVDAGQAPDAAGTPDAGPAAGDAGPHPCVSRAQDNSAIQSQTQGRFTRLFSVPATALGNTRNLTVYAPPGLAPGERLPVLYAHDGQNLFDPAEAAFGVAWELDEAADGLAAVGLRFLVVAVDNTDARMDEYTPVYDASEGFGGDGDAYLDFLVQDVKPLIDARFPTRCEPWNTALMGSSLGGLISFHAARTHPEVFGRIGALSSSFWWAERWTLAQYSQKTDVLLWIDSGTDEGSMDATGLSYVVEDSRDIRDRALSLGHVFGRDLGYLEAERAEHNEWAWQHRLGSVLLFLMGPRTSAPAQAYVFPFVNPVGAGATVQTAVQVTDADGMHLTVPSNLAAIQSSSAAVSVSAGNLLHAQTTGTAALQANYQGVPATGTLQVVADPSAGTEVVFQVEVPAETPAADTVYLGGSAAEMGGLWNPAGVPMQHLHGTTWRAAVVVPTGQALEFKYTRGSWASVEVTAGGLDVPNHGDTPDQPHIRYDVVERWRDAP